MSARPLIRLRLVAAASAALVVPMTLLAGAPPASAAVAGTRIPVVYHRTMQIGGQSIFYREAGPQGAPVVVLLHGFPTSSHMFRRLIPYLADRYHVLAPDYPGFGESSAPDHRQFQYTFANYAELMDQFVQSKGASHYALYLMDYGAPVGYRLALKHPERVSAMIVQNGNAYVEGLAAFWDPIKAYWNSDTPENREKLSSLVAPETTKFQYVDGVADVSRIDPDNWIHDQALLDRPGNKDIQLDLFKDYGSNIPLYPQFQRFFRERQPPTLIVWGKNDKIFPESGAMPYRRDLPKAEYHIFDSGHFLLEDKFDEVAPLIHDFLGRALR